jgi:hypothetical protein
LGGESWGRRTPVSVFANRQGKLEVESESRPVRTELAFAAPTLAAPASLADLAPKRYDRTYEEPRND